DQECLIDKIWKNKPTYSKEKVIVHHVEYAGESCLQKYKRVKETLLSKVKNHTKIALLITRLDDIACINIIILGITNLRGKDIPYNPVFFSFAIFFIDDKEEYVNLFADKEKFDTPEILQHLKDNRITLFSYEELYYSLNVG